MLTDEQKVLNKEKSHVEHVFGNVKQSMDVSLFGILGLNEPNVKLR